MVGFLDGVDMTVKRKGKTGAFSLWHFADRHLCVVESVNNTHEHALAHQILAKQAHLTPEQLADLASSCALPYWLRDHCSHFQGVAHIVTEQWTRKCGAAAGRYHKTFPQVLRPDHRIGQQFTQALRDAIAKGDLKPGQRLPSTRALSVSLGIALGTIVEAFDQLYAEGYLATRARSGTTVANVHEGASPVTSQGVAARLLMKPASQTRRISRLHTKRNTASHRGLFR
ncbi:hypothetical protein RLEG12_08730 (plasmid) [Rhizobium leguminosarum bv. trifolii CB782]|nr:hypothetical protein RLEG12_08730 [Rhizobium leguminosarum bv. trifolii CB782]